MSEGWVGKMEQQPDACRCWDCLRARGITPQRSYAAKHTDVLGAEFRTDNGQKRRGDS